MSFRSAATVDGTTAGYKYETVLELNFDDNTAAGIAATGFNNTSNNVVKNGYMTVIQNAGSGGTLWLANSESVNSDQTTIPSLATDDSTAAEKVKDCLELEPGTTYKITFKYRYRDNAHANAKIDFMCAINPFAATNHGRGSGLSTAIETVIDDNDTQALSTDVFGNTNSWLMDWREETYIFTTKDELTNKYVGLRACYNADYKTPAQIDDFKVEKAVTETYVFDYKNGETAMAVSDITTAHYELAGSSGDKAGLTPSIDETGLHFYFQTGNPIKFSGLAWTHNAAIKDPDANNGEYLYISTGKAYIVTAKYKITDLGGNGNVNIGIGVHNGSQTQAVGSVNHKAVSNDFCYQTQVIDADSVSALGGKFITLIGTTSAGKVAQALVESVVVTVIDKAADEVALVKTTADNYVYDVELVKRGTSLGEYQDVYNPVTAARETAYNISYVDVNIREYEVHTDGDTYAYTPNDSDAQTAIVTTAQDAERGTVIEVKSTSTASSTASFNLNTFQPEAGKKYYLSFDAKLISNNTNSNSISISKFYLASSGGIMQNSNKTEVTADKINLTGDTVTTEWKTIGWVYEPETTVSESYTYLLFAIPYSAQKDATAGPSFVVQIDNFKIVEYTPLGADSAPNNAANAASSIRGVGTKADGSYQSAGIRFKATVDAATKAAASEIGFVVAPAKAAVAYDGEWYAAEGEIATGITPAKKACYVAGTDTDVVYSTDGDGNCDYQMILTGLSTEDGKTAYSQHFVAVMYVKDANGDYSYYNLGETSYNEVLTAYGICGFEVPAN